jgi:hypothetical protein
VEIYKKIFELNLPSYKYQIKKQNDKIFIHDVLRGKYLVLTPEEWVRQHFLNYLVTCINVPKKLMKTELGIKYNKLSKRPDIVVFSTKGTPLLIIECKASFVEVGINALLQLSVYNSQMNATFLAVTNGIRHFYWTKFPDGTYQPLKELPGYKEMDKIAGDHSTGSL